MPLRDDGECFRCHVRGIGFTFAGGGMYGRQNFNNTTNREAFDRHVGDHDRDGIERVR